MLQFNLLVRGAHSGRARGNCGVCYASEGSQARHELFEEVNPRIIVLITLLGQVQARGGHLIGGNEWIDGEPIEQAADKDACAGEQDEGESKLEYDQRA